MTRDIRATNLLEFYMRISKREHRERSHCSYLRERVLSDGQGISVSMFLLVGVETHVKDKLMFCDPRFPHTRFYNLLSQNQHGCTDDIVH